MRREYVIISFRGVRVDTFARFHRVRSEKVNLHRDFFFVAWLSIYSLTVNWIFHAHRVYFVNVFGRWNTKTWLKLGRRWHVSRTSQLRSDTLQNYTELIFQDKINRTSQNVQYFSTTIGHFVHTKILKYLNTSILNLLGIETENHDTRNKINLCKWTRYNLAT